MRLSINRFFQLFPNRVLLLIKYGLTLWIVGCLIPRVALFWAFSGELTDSAPDQDVYLFLIRSFQFDMRVVSIFIATMFVLGLLYDVLKWRFLSVLQNIIKYAFLSIVFILGIFNVAFYAEYHDQFNHWIFNLIYDDLGAILRSIWDMYPVVSFLLGFILCGYLLKKFIEFLERKHEQDIRKELSFVCGFIVFILFIGTLIIGLRGSVGRRPLQQKDIAITQSVFLNKLIPNAPFSLYYAIKDHAKKATTEFGVDILKESIKETLESLYPDKSGTKLDDYLTRKCEGKYRLGDFDHIYLIMMESQDSWPLMDTYQSLGINQNLRAFTEKGIWIPRFVSAGPGTIESLAAVMSGLPDVGGHINYQDTAQKTYSTAIAGIFNQLGFETHFYYGGYLSWQRIGEFASNQGFKDVYGGSHMGSWEGNEWGVFDHQLFDYIVNTHKQKSKKTFNLIMTTSNHPRYIVDLEAYGCALDSIPDSCKGYCDANANLKILGHVKYADQCIGNFIREIEKSNERVLFIITGDHHSRHFLNASPTLYERKSVPLIFYSKYLDKSQIDTSRMYGSHLDIIPTLIEVIAPEGFHYHALGQNIFNNQAPSGAGVGVVITQDAIYDLSSNKYEVNTKYDLNNAISSDTLTKYYNRLHRVGWWKMMRRENITD